MPILQVMFCLRVHLYYSRGLWRSNLVVHIYYGECTSPWQYSVVYTLHTVATGSVQNKNQQVKFEITVQSAHSGENHTPRKNKK